eukprot:555912-Hanusia_phi.AAC.2
MAENAKQIVAANGFEDVITVIQGKVEDIELPVEQVLPSFGWVLYLPLAHRVVMEQVDVIVSEWMGYCLLFEAMFDSIIYARDRSALPCAASTSEMVFSWLRPGGMLLPDKAELYIAAIEDAKYKVQLPQERKAGKDWKPGRQDSFLGQRLWIQHEHHEA